MPLLDAGFHNEQGAVDEIKLVQHGPGAMVIVCGSDTSDLSDPKKFKMVPALIDTGASQSCIDRALADSLNLIQVDKITISGVAGPQEHPVYAAHIIAHGLDIVQFGRFAAVNLSDGGQYQAVLLGRDFLRNVLMIYDGLRGQVTVASPKRA